MNIFVSDIDPIISAINLDDKRVKHMPRECFEMISMAYYKNTGVCIAPFIIWNEEHRADDKEKFNELYNHRCTNWVASKRENMIWLWFHAQALMLEYYYRFDKIHFLSYKFDEIKHYIPIYDIKDHKFTFINATPFTNEKDVIVAYKNVLRYKWFTSDEIQPVIWTKRNKPHWAIPYDSDLQLSLTDLLFDRFEDLPF
jgi:hypothetical protein